MDQTFTKRIPRNFFENFSLPDADGNYFLRPDRILGAFIVDCEGTVLNPESKAHCDAEILNDKKTVRRLNRESRIMLSNSARTNRYFINANIPYAVRSDDSGGDDINDESDRHATTASLSSDSVPDTYHTTSSTSSTSTTTSSSSDSTVRFRLSQRSLSLGNLSTYSAAGSVSNTDQRNHPSPRRAKVSSSFDVSTSDKHHETDDASSSLMPPSSASTRTSNQSSSIDSSVTYDSPTLLPALMQLKFGKLPPLPKATLE
jgi:hypothetical protein